MTKKTFKKAWNNVFNILIDLALIAFGCVLYYHFQIRMLVPVDLNPFVIDVIGSKQLAVLLIAGVPFVIGVLDLARTIFRMSNSGSSKPRGSTDVTKEN